MAVIDWPDDVQIRSDACDVLCIICQEKKLPGDMSVGLCDATGEQAFACDLHFWSSRQFIVGWTDFIIRQHLEDFERMGEEYGYGKPVC